LDAPNPGPDLIVIAERAADEPTVWARAADPGAARAGEFTLAPHVAAVDASVEAGPVVVRHHRAGRRLVVALDRNVRRLGSERSGEQRQRRDAHLGEPGNHKALSPGGWIAVASSSVIAHRAHSRACNDPTPSTQNRTSRDWL